MICRFASLVALLAVGAITLTSAPSAVAAKPCQAVEIHGQKMKIGIIGVDCQSARDRAEEFYERWNPARGYYAIKIEGFVCSTASAGTDLLCHSDDRWIFGTTRPYEDVHDFHPPQDPKPQPPYFRACPSQGFPLENGELERHHLTCSKAKRLISGFMEKALTDGVVHARIDGFACRNVPRRIQPGIICSRADRRARFLGNPPTV